MTIAKGASLLLENEGTIQRFSIGEPTIAEATVLSPREVLISGKTLGVTTLLVWGGDGAVKLYSVEVTADAPGLERYLNTVLPGQSVTVSATGNTVTLSGQVRDASVAQRAVEIAKGSGAVVVDNLVDPVGHPGDAPGPLRRGNPKRAPGVLQPDLRAQSSGCER